MIRKTAQGCEIVWKCVKLYKSCIKQSECVWNYMILFSAYLTEGFNMTHEST